MNHRSLSILVFAFGFIVVCFQGSPLESAGLNTNSVSQSVSDKKMRPLPRLYKSDRFDEVVKLVRHESDIQTLKDFRTVSSAIFSLNEKRIALSLSDRVLRGFEMVAFAKVDSVSLSIADRAGVATLTWGERLADRYEPIVVFVTAGARRPWLLVFDHKAEGGDARLRWIPMRRRGGGQFSLSDDEARGLIEAWGFPESQAASVLDFMDWFSKLPSEEARNKVSKNILDFSDIFASMKLRWGGVTDERGLIFQPNAKEEDTHGGRSTLGMVLEDMKAFVNGALGAAQVNPHLGESMMRGFDSFALQKGDIFSGKTKIELPLEAQLDIQYGPGRWRYSGEGDERQVEIVAPARPVE